MKKIIKVVPVFIMVLFLSCNVSAIEGQDESNDSEYWIQESKDAGNNDYSEENDIKADDLHFGWKLGHFIISGYTQKNETDNNEIVFLKKVGDKVKLYFNLEQNINKLNNDKNMSISSDHNGCDENLGVKKQDFKHGALIIRKRNYQNKIDKPIVYTDFLKSVAKKNTDVQVELLEEGDYEVSLDYEIKKDGPLMFDDYPNYKMFFKFSVRNANCMVYPFDIKTGEELRNNAFTENGFKIQLAKSRYLDITVERSVLVEGEDGLSKEKDIRVNTASKEGDEYKEEGIYVIKARNRYTDEKTTKTICVGNNKILRAYVATNLSIKEIREELSKGKDVNDKGKIVDKNSDDNVENTRVSEGIIINLTKKEVVIVIAGAALFLVIIVWIIVFKIRKKKRIKREMKRIYEEEIERNKELGIEEYEMEFEEGHDEANE